VPRKQYPLAIYPYESPKDIRSIIGWLGYGDRWRSDRDRAHECIAKLWPHARCVAAGGPRTGCAAHALLTCGM
jgi:hypothetical protein